MLINEKRPTTERLGYKKFGVAVFFVDVESGKIWAINENKSKDTTGRTVGNISIPMETRKKGETLMQNLIGSLQEFPKLLGEVELHYIKDASYCGHMDLVPGVDAFVFVIGVKNADQIDDHLMMTDEVEPRGWLSLEELLSQDELLRKGLKNILEFVQAGQFIERFMQKEKDGKDISSFSSTSPDFSYILERENLPDITVE